MPKLKVLKNHRRADGVFYIEGDEVDLEFADIATMPEKLLSSFEDVFAAEDAVGQAFIDGVVAKVKEKRGVS